MRALTIRKIADRSSGTRVTRYDPITGEKYLANPETGQAEPWPLAGVQLVDAPDEVRVSTTVIMDGRREGWVTLEGERVVHRPSGPAGDEHRTPAHTMMQADAVVFHTVDGDVRYRVTHNPDKYVDGDDDEAEVTPDIYEAGQTRVDWFFDLEREG